MDLNLKNSAIIDLNEYNMLRDFKKSVEESETMIIYMVSPFAYPQNGYRVWTENEAIESIGLANNNLSDSLKKQDIKIKEKSREINRLQKEVTKNRKEILKSISFWELFKFKFFEDKED